MKCFCCFRLIVLQKFDAKGKPHVGGNTWAGGSGGADTTGLGGVGGPYRLDLGLGHDVVQVRVPLTHTAEQRQVSDEAKVAVSEAVKKAAKEMAEVAMHQRLVAMEMPEDAARGYTKLTDNVANEVRCFILWFRLMSTGSSAQSGACGS